MYTQYLGCSLAQLILTAIETNAGMDKTLENNLEVIKLSFMDKKTKIQGSLDSCPTPQLTKRRFEHLKQILLTSESLCSNLHMSSLPLWVFL